jgi:hypothetical protein
VLYSFIALSSAASGWTAARPGFAAVTPAPCRDGSRSPGEHAYTARPSPGGHPHAALPHTDGGGLCRLDQALCALVFLYRHILGQHLSWLADVVRAKRPQRLPVVWTRPEVRALLGALDGVHWIMVSFLYGSGLRRLECLRPRVKEMDFASHQILIREGKG